MGRLILLLSAIAAIIWAAGMPLHWIAFLLGVSLSTIIIWFVMLSRRRGRVVGRTYHMKLDGETIEDNEGVDRQPVVDSKVTGVMVEEYASGELRAFTIDRKIWLVSQDEMVVEVLPCGNVFRTGPHINRTEIVIKPKSPRYAPMYPHGNVISQFMVTIVPGPACRVVIRMSEQPHPAQ